MVCIDRKVNHSPPRDIPTSLFGPHPSLPAIARTRQPGWHGPVSGHATVLVDTVHSLPERMPIRTNRTATIALQTGGGDSLGYAGSVCGVDWSGI